AQQYADGGVPYVSLRYANLYGPRQQLSPLGEGNVVSLFLNHFVTGEPITIFGDGTASRDYLYVHDAADAVIRSLTSDFAGPVNVSTARETTVRQLFDTLIAIHGKEHPLVHEPFRAGEVYRSVLGYDSAREKLGWEPRTSLYDGLKASYDWYMGAFGSREGYYKGD
ncbi:MAG: NAD-dependent epimerase/dehydratase family protein, partial [Candidatus Uhrbacteria bacterium]|nr:NAD-dependent epimerase/dehydratase family protein [Candidatus Uhrbacteria bacterium]